MRYKFKTLELHNFLSFGDATINLQDKGYCLISGKNNNPSDRALSNGSGKSTIISGIAYCLTGQTIQGVKSNIENIFTTGGCYVKLNFDVDLNNYIVIRYKNHEKFKTDLKIFKNGEDISGKGIRESENVLAQELPELTLQLLSSVVLLGQGLPSSFTKNTPSGRKELLEQLTGSDFMIEDVKTRINARLDELNGNKRELEDLILSDKTKKDLFTKKMNDLNNDLTTYSAKDYDTVISALKSEISGIFHRIEGYDDRLHKIDDDYSMFTEQLTSVNSQSTTDLNNVYAKYRPLMEDFRNKISETETSIRVKQQELNNIKNIKEFCPTCKQRIVGVVKPDTSGLETDINNLTSIKNELNDNFKYLNDQQKVEIDGTTSRYSEIIAKLNSNLNDLRREKSDISNNYNNDSKLLKDKENELNELQKQKENQDTYITNLITQIAQYKTDIANVENQILYNTEELDNLQQHLDIVTKMSTLVKRDFRGYLLLNIIEYVERKSKEYCDYIFNSNDLEIKLNGNNIDILFSDKDFESLSGGEKQKIDVIIQFAIRDMMSKYLDFKSNILFLDEITDNLDSVGCDGLINLISNTLNDLESIFIISHHKDEIQLPCDTEIVVVKNSNGISEIE